MTEMTAVGHGVEATLTDTELRVRATSRMSRAALMGREKGDTLTLPLSQIASATIDGPALAGGINGMLALRTVEGTPYVLHWRAKKNRDFAALAEAVVAAV